MSSGACVPASRFYLPLQNEFVRHEPTPGEVGHVAKLNIAAPDVNEQSQYRCGSSGRLSLRRKPLIVMLGQAPYKQLWCGKGKQSTSLFGLPRAYEAYTGPHQSLLWTGFVRG